MNLYRISELRIRAFTRGELPSVEELLSLLEDVEDAIETCPMGNNDSESLHPVIAGALEDANTSREEQETAEAERDKAQDRLEEYLQAENDSPEAMAARIVDLTRDITAIREENDGLRRELRELKNPPPAPKAPKRRHRSKKTPPAPAPPEVVLPTYELPKDAPNVVRVAFGAKDPDGAYDLYLKAGEIDENPATYDEAEKMYREAIRLDPSLAVARTNLGNIRFRRGATEEAIGCWQDALRIDPKLPEAYYNIGFVYLEQGDPSRAIPLFQSALQVINHESAGIAADTHYNLASAFDDMGDVESARVHWQKHVDLAPEGEWAEYAKTFLRDTAPSPKPPPVRKPFLITIRGGKTKGKP